MRNRSGVTGNGRLDDGGRLEVLQWGICSDPGPVRQHNEDCAGAHVATDASGRGPLFAVADGLGGHAAGDVASRLAIAALLTTWATCGAEEPTKALRACARSANEAVVAASYEPGHAGMGSTLTAVTFVGREALIAHVGDSRAYLIRDDSCVQLTSDHSRVGEMLRMKLLTPERAANHPARSQLTRSLGSALIMNVDVIRRPIQVGDVFVLCSDGLWDDVSQVQLQASGAALRASAGESADGEARTTARELVDIAIARGAADNVTAVVVHILSDQPVASAEGRRSLFRRRR